MIAEGKPGQGKMLLGSLQWEGIFWNRFRKGYFIELSEFILLLFFSFSLSLFFASHSSIYQEGPWDFVSQGFAYICYCQE